MLHFWFKSSKSIFYMLNTSLSRSEKVSLDEIIKTNETNKQIKKLFGTQLKQANTTQPRSWSLKDVLCFHWSGSDKSKHNNQSVTRSELIKRASLCWCRAHTVLVGVCILGLKSSRATKINTGILNDKSVKPLPLFPNNASCELPWTLTQFILHIPLLKLCNGFVSRSYSCFFFVFLWLSVLSLTPADVLSNELPPPHQRGHSWVHSFLPSLFA